MKRMLSAALAAVGLSGIAVLASAPVIASAGTGAVYGPIAARLGSLNTKLKDLHQHSPLTSSDSYALCQIITRDISGLTQLNAEIQSTSSKQQLAQDKLDVYRDFYVYLLVGPQFDLTTAADAGAQAAADLRNQEPSLQSEATTPLKKAEYANLVVNVNTALAILPGIGPSVLSQTPFTNFRPVVATDAKAVARGLAALDKAEADASLIAG